MRSLSFHAWQVGLKADILRFVNFQIRELFSRVPWRSRVRVAVTGITEMDNWNAPGALSIRHTTSEFALPYERITLSRSPRMNE